LVDICDPALTKGTVKVGYLGEKEQTGTAKKGYRMLEDQTLCPLPLGNPS